MNRKNLFAKNGRLTGTLLSLATICCYLCTAGQLLTRLTGHHPVVFVLWWLFKMAISALVVLVPILIGNNQHCKAPRWGMAALLGLIGAVGFLWAKYTTQPVLDVAQPSPELYVAQQVFIAWLSSIGLFAFAAPLQRLLHRWSVIHRRQWLIAITAAYFLIRLFNAYDALGFHRGTSIIWFIYLFAVGDWLAKWRGWQYAAVTIAGFAVSGILTWLNMNRVIYSPHAGLTPDNHYLLAINAFQPLVVITCILVTAWLGRSTGLHWANDRNDVQLILLLGLLGTPQAVTPILLTAVKWPLAVAAGLVLTLLAIALPPLVVKLGHRCHVNFDWRQIIHWGWNVARRYWPLLLTYLALWVITVASFAYLWGNDWTMVQWVITQREQVVTVNVLIVLAFVLILMAITNRWWFSSGLGIAFYLGWLVASVLKIAARNEPILPTDLAAVKALCELLGMVDPWLVAGVVVVAAVLLVCFAWVEYRYGQSCRFNAWGRVTAAVLVVAFLACFTRANHSNTVVYKQLQRIDDTPYFYAQLRGAKMNGTLLQFANNVDVHVMAKPAGYSAATMRQIGRRYAKEGRLINQQRSHQSVGRQNLVIVLSESFADPARIPGMKVAGGDPLPFLHQFKKQTTSGLMLSSGYGGGTANMEYQALTGLSMANFSPTMPTPYSQLVPFQKHTFTINNLFKYSIGIHPFTANLYSRQAVYRKFGFNKFYHFAGGSKITYTSKIQHNPRVSDDATYREIDLNLRRRPHGKFVQVATMQNHMPYEPAYYQKRQYHVSGRGFNNSDQQGQIEAYIQGLHYTDQALKEWVHRLDESKQPTTVVWCGDHLPGIYHGLPMGKYGIPLHETDYFIYSNKAAQKLNHDRLTIPHRLVSPNDFAALALMKMDVKVSPYYALLTRVAMDLPAISLPTNGTAKNNSAHQGGIDFIDDQGRRVKLNRHQQRLFRDYQLVQYDLTAGHHYLQRTSFLKRVAR